MTADVIEALSGYRPEWGRRVITSAVADSRQAISGCLFVALPGENHDGHQFIGEAFEKGACLAFVQQDVSERFQTLDLRGGAPGQHPQSLDEPICLLVDDCLAALQQTARFWRRKLDVKVIGVTGSVGKSTTKELITEVLSQRYRVLKNPGNLNNEIGLPLTMLSLNETHQRAVLEMGFYVPGEIALLCDLASPTIGVITNIGTVHAERAGTQADIARGKAELIQALPPAPQGVAILNYDDAWVHEMAELTKARIFYYGLDPAADLWADGVEGLGLDGIRFRLHYQREALHLRIPLIGRHSVQTALRAASVGLVEGLSWQEIVEGLRSGHAQLRLITTRTENGALILDDSYNASPESTLAALNLLDDLAGRKVAVLGDMLELGIYETQGHELVGVRAAQVADLLVTVGELGKIIASAARQAGFSPSATLIFSDVDQVIDYLKQNLVKDDVVLVKGSRGMRMDRIVTALEARS